MAWRIGETLSDGRCRAASAERNRDPILAVLERVLPERGLVLEIGSGTGQHIVHFARALPKLVWQPSDVEAGLRRSVSAWIAQERLPNVNEPVPLDVHQSEWPVTEAEAIVCINVLHVAPWATTPALFAGAARVLTNGCLLYLYGPYRRGGCHTAPSNERFDAELRAFDPEWGVRDLDDVQRAASSAGFALCEVTDMPANNLSVVFRKTVSASA
jgi:hypothetical protein